MPQRFTLVIPGRPMSESEKAYIMAERLEERFADNLLEIDVDDYADPPRDGFILVRAAWFATHTDDKPIREALINSFAFDGTLHKFMQRPSQFSQPRIGEPLYVKHRSAH